VIVRFDHVIGIIVNAKHSIMWTAAVDRVADCVDRFTEPVYWGVERFSRKAALLGHACKEEHEVLVKALNEFLSLVQNGFKVIDAHANDASDADYQKQMEALRARAQQHLDWGREQLAALQWERDGITLHRAS
jgi:hypothetical protein